MTRRLRRECPWDREQDERTIVPHTLEEAYELADAAHSGDDRRLLDELGDVLFQVHFLALLLEERGSGDLAAVADHCREKLIRRHPHVFGDARSETAEEVLRRWDAIKLAEPGREPGIFGEVPELLPALLHARKLQRRASSAGLAPAPDRGADLAALRTALDELEDDRDGSERFRALGELLFAAVALARALRVDPEIALRAASERFRRRIETAAAAAAHSDPDGGAIGEAPLDSDSLPEQGDQ